MDYKTRNLNKTKIQAFFRLLDDTFQRTLVILSEYTEIPYKKTAKILSECPKTHYDKTPSAKKTDGVIQYC